MVCLSSLRRAAPDSKRRPREDKESQRGALACADRSEEGQHLAQPEGRKQHRGTGLSACSLWIEACLGCGQVGRAVCTVRLCQYLVALIPFFFHLPGFWAPVF